MDLRRRLLHTTTLGAALGAAGLAVGGLPASAQAASVTLLNGTEHTIPLGAAAVPQHPRRPAAQMPPVTIDLTAADHSSSGAQSTPGGPPAKLPRVNDIHGRPVGPPRRAPAVAPGVAGQHAQADTGGAQPPVAHPQAAKPVPPGSSARPAKPGTAKRPAPRPAAALPRAPAPAPAIAIAAAPAVPALALSPLAPAPIGVPDFFIDSFQIPPFLVPLFQAAGVEYSVPWQILAAINEVETDYGRNLTVSSAGAVGWMQFLPQTWVQYGVDANGDGVKDPYNPADAIFATARFLHAAGASQNLTNAVSAFNNASWFVGSVMLRAKLIGGLPDDLVDSIAGITDGLFPIEAASHYATNLAPPAPGPPAARTAGARPAPSIAASSNIYARAGAAVLAVHDGVIAGIGRSPTLGNFVRLRDAFGNTYTYSQLKKLAVQYAAPLPPRRTAAAIASVAQAPRPTPPADVAPLGPASAGNQYTLAAASPVLPSPVATDTPAGPLRLFANPTRPAAFAAGGREQVIAARTLSATQPCPQAYGLSTCAVELKALTAGTHVPAGAVLGRIGLVSPSEAPHLRFQIVPAGKGVRSIDPKPILDGWMLLRSAAIHPPAPLAGTPEQAPTVGQLLLETDAQLRQRVLGDPTIELPPCSRAAIQAGLIDRRVLATLALLAQAGFKAKVAALGCAGPPTTLAAPTTAAVELPSSDSVDIAAINAIPILDHQGAGSIADEAIQQVLSLQGIYKPRQIISLMTYPTTDNTFADYDHADHIQIAFAAPATPVAPLGAPLSEVLGADQWRRLADRLGQIGNPAVAAQPSSAAIPATPGG